MSKEAAWLDEYIPEVFRALGTMDFGTLQPFGHLQYHPLYAKEWCAKISQTVDNAIIGEISLDNYSLTELRCHLYFYLLDAKCARVEKKERMRIAEFFNKLILKKAKADPYGSKSNIVHTQGQVEKMLSSEGWQKGTPQASREIGMLFSSTLQFVHGLYADIYTDYGTENFGPYDASAKYGKGAILVIRNFDDLKPTALWKEASDSPASTLRISTVYNKNVKFSCDLISCHSQYEGSLPENLLAFKVEKDGKPISLGEVDKLAQTIALQARAQWKRLIGDGFEHIKQKGLLQRSYTLKKVFEQCGVDWKPDKQMREVVKGKQYADESYWNFPSDEKEAHAYWEKMFDPRVDFYPAGAKK